ncbi:caspase family protein [Desulfobacter latus]|uniref:Caspase family protein n=1 Tax=Desulfobacter latus TaxID=2292 RepID=A0A850T8Z1_9BACT|nr:caspase family protein [Desulfobacter latus]NWH05992.1 caspase family protein [Desulfobacter latus]
MNGYHYCMHRGICLILICLLLSAWPAFAENRALIIGVGKYQISSGNLPGIDKDVEMAKKVAQAIGFKSHQIKVLRDEQATLDNIGNTISDWLIKGTTKNDRVFFYFSGHGSHVADTDRDEKDKADEVLLPHDTQIKDKTLKNVFLDDVFGKMLAKIPARESFIFIDACHSGTSTKSFAGMDQKAKFFIYPGMPRLVGKANFSTQPRRRAITRERFASLSACQDDETAIATREGSLFTRGLYDAVTKSNGKSVSLKQLKKSTTAYIAAHTSPDKVHHPDLAGSKKLQGKSIHVTSAVTSSSESSLWDRVLLLTEGADYKVPVRTNQSKFKEGDLLEVSLTMPHDGYVNVINLSPNDTKPAILFPNGYHKENFFKAGTRITIPSKDDDFNLPASPPFGKTLIAVFVTTQKINSYKKGLGNSGDLIKLMSSETAEEFDVVRSCFSVQPKSLGLGAGNVIALVEQ